MPPVSTTWQTLSAANVSHLSWLITAHDQTPKLIALPTGPGCHILVSAGVHSTLSHHVLRDEPAMNLEAYLPVLLFILVGLAIGVAPQAIGYFLGPQRPNEAKNSPYECGFEAFEDARMKFDVRYYLVAILFILFDLEIAFLFPWAVALKEIGPVGFWAMMIFLAILVVGFAYEWKKGALDWE
jgi:NADH-quinone oxidoreductase subunit A